MVIRLVSEEDLIKNEYILKRLLEENLRINIKGICNMSESAAISGYNNMIRFIRDGSAIIIGAFMEPNLIGFIWAYRKIFLGEDRLYISHIIVDSNVRYSGIGKQLLQFLEDIAKQKDIKRIELMATIENEAAINFYKKNGFIAERIQLEKELG